jgi:hypothetical protein
LGPTLDPASTGGDRSIHGDPAVLPHADYLPWICRVKFTAAKNLAQVSAKVLHACGGTGYKPALAIARDLRDGKAGWVDVESSLLQTQPTGMIIARNL